MNIVKRITVPTGDILVVKGDYGLLECVSLGDYGKEVNIKADFLGLVRPIERVEHRQVMPLSEKWVITISTQYGCPVQCRFCDVLRPEIKEVNATYEDLKNQVITALQTHPEVKSTKRLNIHFARMGEPTYNFNVITFAENLKKDLRLFIAESLIHPVVSTMLPKNKYTTYFVMQWARVKNNTFEGDAGLQFSINSTSDEERSVMFNGKSMSLDDISSLAYLLPNPKGRKYTLNFAVAGYEIDPAKLVKLFSPEKFIVKLTPMHKTAKALSNGIETNGDYTTIYPYQETEEVLKDVGFDVLVFLASREEDESRITCGNAIISGSASLNTKNGSLVDL